MSTSTPRRAASLSAATRCESGEKYAVCNRIRCREERMSTCQTVDVVPADAGRAAHDLGRDRTRLRLVEAVTLVVEGAPGLGPVLDEGRGQAGRPLALPTEVLSRHSFSLRASPPTPRQSPPGEPGGFVVMHFAMTW